MFQPYGTHTVDDNDNDDDDNDYYYKAYACINVVQG